MEEPNYTKLDLYGETIHHHDRTYIRIYRDYLTLFKSPVKAAILRLLESARGAEVVAHSSLFAMLHEVFALTEAGLKAHLNDLVEQGYVESRYNGVNRTYRMNAPVVQKTLDALQETTNKQ